MNNMNKPPQLLVMNIKLIDIPRTYMLTNICELQQIHFDAMHSLVMEPLLVTFALFTAVGVLIYKYLTWHHDLFKKLGIAGPQPKLLTGNFPGKKHFVYEIDDIYK